MRFSTALLAAVSAFAATSAAIDTIEVKDRHFVYSSTQKPFWVAGVDYQPGGSEKVKSGSDPLSDSDACARDIYLFQQLGINTIRVYSVDPTADHDDCMTLLAQAGIYLILDVNSPLDGQHLNNHEPWTTYTEKYLTHVFSVMDTFAGYNNTLGFLAGNEVIFDSESAKTSPNYVKAVVRDMKDYISNHIARKIPVGYSNADDLKFRTSLAAYLQCGDEQTAIDFWGVNSYQWCGDNTFKGSGYDTLVESYKNYSLPIIFTEYGCNEVTPRKFQEVEAIYSSDMTGVFSGGLVYEFVQESNNYGLIEVGKDNGAETMDDYTTFQKQLSKVDVSTIAIPSDEEKNERPSTCPDENSSVFDNITANLTLPTTLAADIIKNGLPSSAGVTRGKFLDSSKVTTATKYSIKLNGKTVSDKTVKATNTTDGAPLASGGSGTSSSSSSSSSGTGNSSSAAMTLSPRGAGGLGASAIVVVALGFGLFL